MVPRYLLLGILKVSIVVVLYSVRQVEGLAVHRVRGMEACHAEQA